MKQELRLATVFSGIGAVEHALQRMNIPYEIVFACDIDSFVKQSYFANYDIDESHWFNDVKDINGLEFRGKIDLLVGGSPCQSFSMVGHRKGLEDPRGLLIYEFFRLVREIQPKVFIYENVKGLLNHGNSKTWKKLELEFRKIGYTFYVNVLNAENYGIPQHRERMFVIGFRNNVEFKFPKPIPLEITMQDLLEDNPNAKYFLPEKGVAFVTNPKNIKKRYTQIDGKIALCQKASQQFNWHGDFIMINNKKQVEDKYYLSEKVAKYVLASGTKNFYSKPVTDLTVARAILSTVHKMHRAGVDNYITRGTRIRKLTPRECLRLMGFDDRFRIVVSDTQMYRQAGNSIVVDVLIQILENILVLNPENPEESSMEQDTARAEAYELGYNRGCEKQ